MKILMIFQAAPLPPPLDMGSAKRNFPFFKENLKRHELWVISYGSPEDERLFRQEYGSRCLGITFVDGRRSRLYNVLRRFWFLVSGKSMCYFLYSRKMQRAIDDAVRREKFDLVHCCISVMGLHRLPKNIPLVGDTHNVEYDLIARRLKEARNIFEKLYWYWGLKTGKNDEIRSCKVFDVLMTTTERDRQIFRKDLPEMRIEVIQNGVDPSFLTPQEVTAERNSMAFLGLMNYYPNEHALWYFLDEIFPLILSATPDARLYVVGANPSKQIRERASKNVIVTGFVKDIKPFVARAEVFVIPLRIGGGIRGKALEAMALRVPIVSTTLGCEGINLRHEESALFADSPGDFASCVLRLFQDPALRNRLASKAYENVVEGYNWEAKGNSLEKIYQSLRGAKGSMKHTDGKELVRVPDTIS